MRPHSVAPLTSRTIREYLHALPAVKRFQEHEVTAEFRIPDPNDEQLRPRFRGT